MQLDYNHLAALAAVIRTGSFDKAATALGVTPSAVSQRIKLLEERTGTVLVVRAARRVPLLPPGSGWSGTPKTSACWKPRSGQTSGHFSKAASAPRCALQSMQTASPRGSSPRLRQRTASCSTS